MDKLTSSDPHQQVRAAYDAIAVEYLARMNASSSLSGVIAQARRLVDDLKNRLPAGASVVDLGCGAGVPATGWLAEEFHVTGVDFSASQLELARRNVPGASFIESDMLNVDFAEGSVDAVTAFFSVIHIQREKHAELYVNISRWLKPGGIFLASLGKKAAEQDWDDDWLGARMFWSYHEPEVTCGQIENAGMTIERSWLETIDDGIDGPETFFWVVARKSEVSRPANSLGGS